MDKTDNSIVTYVPNQLSHGNQAQDISPVEILALMLIACADKAKKTCTSLLIAMILRYSARLMTTGTLGVFSRAHQHT